MNDPFNTRNPVMAALCGLCDDGMPSEPSLGPSAMPYEPPSIVDLSPAEREAAMTGGWYSNPLSADYDQAAASLFASKYSPTPTDYTAEILPDVTSALQSGWSALKSAVGISAPVIASSIAPRQVQTTGGSASTGGSIPSQPRPVTQQQQRALATQIQQQSRQPVTSGIKFQPRTSAPARQGSISTPWLIGLGVAGVLGIGLIAYTMKDD